MHVPKPPRAPALAVVALLALASAWTPDVRAQDSQGAPRIEQQMTPEQFRAAGLDRLTPEQLANLNAWLNRTLVVETQKAAAQAKKKASSDEVVEKTSVRELFDYVLNEGKKDFTVQRYKGLGEMTSEQLWDTTMIPEKRTLLEVKLEDIAECEAIFTTLMGEDVEARRKFIEENALDVKNLDI